MIPETSYPAVLGALLASKRKKMRLDQATVAKKIGVSRPTWSRIESGDVALGIDQLPKVAELFGYKGGMSELIREADEVVEKMRLGGITVHNERVSTTEETRPNTQKPRKNKMITGLSLLSAAALALWISRK